MAERIFKRRKPQVGRPGPPTDEEEDQRLKQMAERIKQLRDQLKAISDMLADQ